MGAKTALENKFVELCNAIEPFDAWVYERRDGGASFLLSITENESAEVHATWEKLVELISSPEALDSFLSSELAEDIDEDEDCYSEDPFCTGELIMDVDGRVHFASDISDQ